MTSQKDVTSKASPDDGPVHVLRHGSGGFAQRRHQVHSLYIYQILPFSVKENLRSSSRLRRVEVIITREIARGVAEGFPAAKVVSEGILAR